MTGIAALDGFAAALHRLTATLKAGLRVGRIKLVPATGVGSNLLYPHRSHSQICRIPLMRNQQDSFIRPKKHVAGM